MPNDILKTAVTAATIQPDEGFIRGYMNERHPDHWIVVGGYKFAYNVSRCNKSFCILKVKKDDRWYKIMIYTPPNLEISPINSSPAIAECKDKINVVKNTFPNKDVQNLIME